MNYQIAIMSYARPDRLRDSTLQTLDRHHADHSRITIFVANQEQYKIYEQVVPPTIKLMITTLGHFQSIRAAQMTYERNTPLLILDDDIAAFEEKQGDSLVQFAGNIDDLVATGFEICRKTNSRMWGIYPVRNAFFMSDEIVVGLRYIIGCCWGTYAQDIAITTPNRLTASSGNDYETTLQSFIHHGSVVRLNYITAKTDYFASGGIDAELKTKGIVERQKDHTRQLKRIAYRHPKLASTYSKAGGITNLRLKRITRQRIPKPNNL